MQEETDHDSRDDPKNNLSQEKEERRRDPQVFLSAERTLLSWTRTTLQMVAIGFVIARFGMALEREGGNSSGGEVSTVIGAGFALLGAVGQIQATWQHRHFCMELGEQDTPPGYVAGSTLWYAWLMAGLGVALAGLLLWGMAVPASGLGL